MHGSLAEQAADLGIQAVGVAPAIEEVRALYPWAESVVSAAVSYLPPDPGAVPDGAHGLVARVARGADYHVVVRDKLSRLVEFLTSGLGARRLEISVDTCPLPERELAVLSGIAWLGRNCCVYVDGSGSYVALGDIVTDARLELSEGRQASRCGDCTLCLDACPTGALTGPGKLDRSRCLSHITQAGGEIPFDLKRALGNRVYGCDVCLEVCPHNSGLVPINPEFAEARFPGAYPDLGYLSSLTREEFDREVRPSSIGWIGRSRLRRNAIIAQGNLAAGSQSRKSAPDSRTSPRRKIIRLGEHS